MPQVATRGTLKPEKGNLPPKLPSAPTLDDAPHTCSQKGCFRCLWNKGRLRVLRITPLVLSEWEVDIQALPMDKQEHARNSWIAGGFAHDGQWGACLRLQTHAHSQWVSLMFSSNKYNKALGALRAVQQA